MSNDKEYQKAVKELSEKMEARIDEEEDKIHSLILFPNPKLTGIFNT